MTRLEKYALVALAIVAAVAFGAYVEKARADTLYLHGYTEHYVACDTPCNETNLGVSYKRDLGDNFVHAGVFDNSQSNPAAFGAYGWSRDYRGYRGWKLGASAGLAVGYVDKLGVTGAGIVPFAALSAERGPVYLAIVPGAVTAAVRIPLGERQ